MKKLYLSLSKTAFITMIPITSMASEQSETTQSQQTPKTTVKQKKA